MTVSGSSISRPPRLTIPARGTGWNQPTQDISSSERDPEKNKENKPLNGSNIQRPRSRPSHTQSLIEMIDAETGNNGTQQRQPLGQVRENNQS